ncbi:MAG: copper-binding protein [Anderseniella sp.]|jgi:Cu/Ag efflux protein CusF|nr:copper-binding protein [Anderseniella sp.]
MKLLKSLALVAGIALSATTALAEEAVWTKGEVVKVDLAQSKITVKHEEIKNLDMPSMTMVFFAPEKSVIEGLKEGDTKEFEFGDMNGRMIVKQVK